MANKNKYTSFQTKEKLNNINKHNMMVIEDYRIHLKSEAKSKKTIEQYINDLKIFACYIYDEYDNVPFYKISAKQIRRFIIYLQENDTSGSRINRILSSMRTMYTFAVIDEDFSEMYKTNPVQYIKGVKKNKKRDIEFLTMEEITYLHDYLCEKKEYQQALFLAILVDSVGRKNEVYQVQKSSITLDEGTSLTNEVIGKGGKKFRLVIHTLTKKTFPLYLEQRGDDKEDYLWYRKNKNGEISELSISKLYYWVKEWREIIYKKFGTYKDINVHSFRHTGLELYHRGEHYACKDGKKIELPVLKAIANHNDISTTNSYLKDDRQEVVLNAFDVK